MLFSANNPSTREREGETQTARIELEAVPTDGKGQMPKRPPALWRCSFPPNPPKTRRGRDPCLQAHQESPPAPVMRSPGALEGQGRGRAWVDVGGRRYVPLTASLSMQLLPPLLPRYPRSLQCPPVTAQSCCRNDRSARQHWIRSQRYPVWPSGRTRLLHVLAARSE